MTATAKELIMNQQHTALAPSGPWGSMGPMASPTQSASVRPSRPVAAPVLQLAAGLLGGVALLLPGAHYSEHTPFGDVHASLSAGGDLFLGIGTEENMRGIINGFITAPALGLWSVLVMVLALIAMGRRRGGTGLTGLVVSAVAAGVAAVQLWSLVSIVLQLDLEGSGWPDPGMAVVLVELVLAITATALWQRHVRRQLNS
ncbi:hypothetical protein ACQBAR_04865 [Propionibacteriaceae bacterium Y1685]